MKRVKEKTGFEEIQEAVKVIKDIAIEQTGIIQNLKALLSPGITSKEKAAARGRLRRGEERLERIIKREGQEKE